MWEFRDGWGRDYTDVPEAKLLAAVKRVDRHLLAGASNESVATWHGDDGDARLILHLADDDRYMAIYIDPIGRELTAMADGDPARRVGIVVRGERRIYPADHFIEPPIAAAVVEHFVYDGGLDPSVNWRPAADPA